MKRIQKWSALLMAVTLLFTLAAPAALAAESTVTIKTAEDLAELSRNCTLDTWSQGKTVILKNDLDLHGVDFTPIPTFSGTFQGNGHTISGLTLTGSGNVRGLFRYIQNGATVQDLTVTGTIHPNGHQDELGLLAGAERVEATLFGNGERTGNVDAVTLAMNMYSHGVDPKLDFSDMPDICATYERVTRMHIYERTPYAGQLVFAAFSGSHQDAIAKGMAYRKEHGEHRWTCPYIPVDPHDIGRTYDADVIRINSQSGKGGIGFVLEQNFGYNLPPKMREALGYKVKSVSDHSHKELSANEVLRIFEDAFLNRCKPLNVLEAHFAQVGGITATVTLELNGQRKVVTSVGNGRLDAVANAIQSATGMEFHLETYSEHSLDEGSTSRAASYVGLVWGDNTVTWGAGTDTDIIVAGIKALVSAINNK